MDAMSYDARSVTICVRRVINVYRNCSREKRIIDFNVQHISIMSGDRALERVRVHIK